MVFSNWIVYYRMLYWGYGIISGALWQLDESNTEIFVFEFEFKSSICILIRFKYLMSAYIQFTNIFVVYNSNTDRNIYFVIR